MDAAVQLTVELEPASSFRLPLRVGMDGMMRRRGSELARLLHHGEQAVLVRVAQPEPGRVVIGALARGRRAAEHGIERMRFALGVDDDLRPFLREFSGDPLIERSIRRRPWLRVSRRPDPFEALAWAICQQLIEYERAAEIERRLLAAVGRCSQLSGDADGLVDMPTAATLAGAAPAQLESFGLAGSRARSLIRAAREVASGRIDLAADDHERGWARLRAIPGIGAWTTEVLALSGQGRTDQLPAGDLAYLKLVGRILGGGDPRARASEDQVRAFFAPYGRWAGLAAAHMMRA